MKLKIKEKPIANQHMIQKFIKKPIANQHMIQKFIKFRLILTGGKGKKRKKKKEKRNYINQSC